MWFVVIKSWRDVPEFAGAEVTDVRFDGVRIPFKQKLYDSLRVRLHEVGEQVQEVVVGRGSFIDPMLVVIRTERFLLLGNSASYWRFPVPTTVPIVTTRVTSRGIWAELDVELDGRTGRATGFPLEPLFQIIESAGPTGMTLNNPHRVNPHPRVAAPAPPLDDLVSMGAPEPQLEAELLEDHPADADIRVAPDGELKILSGREFERALGIEPLTPQAEVEWFGPVRDFEDSERFAAAHMRYLGFGDASETEAGTDSGVDVESSRAVAQVKFHAKPVGSPGLQNLRGVAWQKEYAIFYSLSGYTQRALDWADQNHICLFSYTKTGTVEPSNDAAAALDRKSRAMLAESEAVEDV